MTPIQKAAELINKMYYTQSSPVSWQQAKQCAIIAVKEILNIIEYSSQADELSKSTYWDTVKQEIEKL